MKVNISISPSPLSTVLLRIANIESNTIRFTSYFSTIFVILSKIAFAVKFSGFSSCIVISTNKIFFSLTKLTKSKEYLDKIGIPNSDFRPRVVSLKLLQDADLIITMELYHKEQIIQNYNLDDNFKSKIFTLKEFNGEKEDLDIIDPLFLH